MTEPQTYIDPVLLDILMAINQIRSDTQLAQAAHCDRNTVIRIRQRKMCNTGTLNAIAIALKCNPKDLLATPGHPDPKAVGPAMPIL